MSFKGRINVLHFTQDMQNAENHMRSEAQNIPQRDSFQYLRLIISQDGEFDEDVNHEIRAIANHLEIISTN